MEVVTLNKEAFSKRCDELVSKLDFNPSIIVGMVNGGGYVIEEIKEKNYFPSIIFCPVLLQRKNNFKKNSLFKYVARLFPYSISNRLRNYESKKAEKALDILDFNELSNYVIDFKLDIKKHGTSGKILVIDDAIDTGKTMFMVKNNLTKQCPNAEIKTAVISWTLEKSLETPDYFIFKNKLVRFPWSKDYKGKDRF